MRALAALAAALLLTGCGPQYVMINTAVGDGCFASRGGLSKKTGNGSVNDGAFDFADAFSSRVGCPLEDPDGSGGGDG